MRRSVLFILIALTQYFVAAAQDRDYYPPTVVPDRIILNLTDSPTESMAVTWRTAAFVRNGYVQFTEADPQE